MKFLLKIFCLASLAACNFTPQTVDKSKNNVDKMEKPAEYALVIHGGAGTILKKDISPEREAAIRKAMDEALSIGEDVLKNGGSAMDAVEKTIVSLEDCPFFNAGRGAVFNHDGKNELDASFMNGATQKAGAVGSVSMIKNPIKLARAVMEKSPHVLLTGRGAEQFGIENGIETAPPEWFFTQERWDALQKELELEKTEGQKPRPDDSVGRGGAIFPKNQNFRNPDSKFGTVGCVALDKSGNLAAGTSTGGMTNKRWNRLGDSPIIGAGTYCDNAVCGVSCTGHGEFFIRYAVAHDVWALMSYKNWSVGEASDFVVNKKLVEKGGEGGLIAMDKFGNIATPFNSEGMYRGWAKPGERVVKIYKE